MRYKILRTISHTSRSTARLSTWNCPSKPSGKGTKVVAPLPGTITDVKVAVGDTVKTGDTVVILEAMKMQNNIEAEADGTITEIHVGKGDTVMEGTPLVTIG